MNFFTPVPNVNYVFLSIDSKSRQRNVSPKTHPQQSRLGLVYTGSVVYILVVFLCVNEWVSMGFWKERNTTSLPFSQYRTVTGSVYSLPK